MPGTVVIPEATPRRSAGGRVVDTRCRAAHPSDELRVLRSTAQDLVEDRVHAATHAIRFTRRKLDDLRYRNDEFAHRIRRDPLKFVASAAAATLFIGLTAGWITGRLAERRMNRALYWR